MAARRFRALVIVWKAFSYTLGALVIAFVLAQLWFYGHILYWSRYPPAATAFIERSRDALQAKDPRARLKHQWVPYERISPQLKRAVVAAEDARFLDHEGFDWEMIQKAIERNEKRGRVVAGASTISQQLAKNLFLSPPRTYLRKAHEAVITLMIERVLSKRRILEVYLNVIEWGDGIYGAEAAAQHYYGEAAADLAPEEAARLAAMIPSPRYYTNNPSTPYLDERTEILLDEMEHMRVP